MSGYHLRVIDLDTIFEPLAPGDARYPQDTGFFSETGVDAKDKYAQLALGARYHEDVGHVRLDTDLRDIFAALGSVPRFNPLPWLSNPGPRVPPVIYRQPSRALLTKVDVVCRILEDGRCELTAQSPNVHSNPNARINDVLYGLTDTPIWDNSKVPASADFEVSYELVSGSGWSIDNGIGFGTWTRLTPGHVGTTLRGQLVYNHATDAEGVVASQPKVKIHLRRTDYPSTNKISGVITANLRLTVSPSLFTPVTNWAKTITSNNNASTNYHNPDSDTGNFKASTKVEFNNDGTLLCYSLNSAGVWVLVLSARWRRSDAETAIDDYDVLCEVTDLVGVGTVGNPIGTWTQVTAGYVIIFDSVYSNHNSPGAYVSTRTLNLSIRQRSTRGYKEAGVTLPDNYVFGQIYLSNTVVIRPPALFDWPDSTAWRGLFTDTKSAQLNPGVSGSLSESVGISFNASGAVEVGSTQRVLGSGRWLPNGVNPNQIEMRTLMSATGVGSEVDELSSWVTVSTGVKSVRSISSIAAAVGSATRQYQGNIQMRRKSYPSDTIMVPLTLKPVVEYTAPPAYQWPSGNWAGTRTAKRTVPFTPESPNSVLELLGVYFNSSGSVTIDRSIHGPGDNGQISAGSWLPAGVNASEVEVMVTGSFSGDAGTDVNQLSTWTQVLTGTKFLTLNVTRDSSVSGLGTSSRNFTGTVYLRRKSYPSDQVSFAINLTPSAEIAAPVAPDWSGMTLPDLIYTVSKDLNLVQPTRFETVKVQYVMGASTGEYSKNVAGHHIYDTQLSGNPDGVDSDVIAVNTRITPEGWSPALFEWSYRLVSGNVDNIDPGVWKGMATTSHALQSSVTTNHGSGVGTFKRTGIVEIIVRRKAYPSHTHTFTCKLEPTITLIQNGPAWGEIILPDHSTTVQAGAGQSYPNASDGDVCSTGYQIAVNDGGFNSYLNKHSYYGSDLVPGKIDNVIDARFTPSNWDVDDLEWKFDVVSEVGGTFDPGYYLPGPLLAPGQWGNVTALLFVPFFTVNRTTKNIGDSVVATGKINVTVRSKTQPTFSHTYPTVTFTNRIDYVAPALTLWPRPDYQGWAGTYYHTTEVEVKPSYSDWANDFIGETRGQSASYRFSFKSDGTWTWKGNGDGNAEGRWAPAPTSGGSYSIRATGVTTINAGTNINTNWQTIGVERYITLGAGYPPPGEVDTTNLWRGNVEIRDDTTGKITAGLLNLDIYSLR